MNLSIFPHMLARFLVLVKCLLKSLTHFPFGLSKYFHPSLWFVFSFFKMASFDDQFLMLIELDSSFIPIGFVLLLRYEISLFSTVINILCSVFFWKFIVLKFTFRSLSGIDFCVWEEAGPRFIFPCGEPVVSALTVMILSPSHWRQSHVCHRLAVLLCVGLFLASLCRPLVYMTLSKWW